VTALRLSAVSKTFGATRALRSVDLAIGGGEIHGLLGENGSGKSTLVKVLTGYHAPDPGGALEAWEAAVPLPVRSPERHGIAVIHQDLGLVESMSVTENIGVGVGYAARPFGPVRWNREKAAVSETLAALGVDLDPDCPVAELTAAERTLVAIARARRQIERHGGDRLLLVLDEPTVALPPRETEQILGLMRTLAARGDAILFISHRLAEVLAVTDRVTVLRDGEVVASSPSAGANEAELARLILGRSLGAFYPTPEVGPAETVALRAEGLSGRTLRDASFTVREREIVGFTGLTGQGHEELPALLAGAARPRSGTVQVGGRRIAAVPRSALDAGLALVPANRRRDGLWPEASAWENLSLPVLRGHLRARTYLDPRSERAAADALVARFDVRPADARLPTTAFSGGNQQKIVMAKWLQRTPSVLLLDEPTQGVDAGARRQLLEIVCAAAAEGTAVAVFSTDLEQLAAVCHRVLVFHAGRVTHELECSTTTKDELAAACRSPHPLTEGPVR
jgi:ribose transport system ATP-binding protein